MVEWRRQREEEARAIALAEAADVLGVPVEEASWAVAAFDAPELRDRHERRMAEIDAESQAVTARFVARW